MKENGPLKRAISLFVVICFLTTSAIAMPAEGTLYGALEVSIKIPAAVGSVVETYTATTKQGISHVVPRSVIYIQDAHDSLEAQENIANMVRHLVKDYGVRTVYEEGYEGPVPTDELFSGVQNPQLREKISYYLMDKLRVGGAEYAHINRAANDDWKLVGADSIALHLENIRAYEYAAKKREGITQDIRRIHIELSKLVDRYFPQEMKLWMKLRERYQGGQMPLVEYLERTYRIRGARTADGIRPPFPGIAALLSGDEKKVRTLSPAELLKEVRRLEEEVVETKLLEERDQKTYGYCQSVLLLEKLNLLQLGPEEYAAVKDSLERLKTEDVARFIARESRRSTVLYSSWETLIADSIDFYELAKRRDGAIAKIFDESPSPAPAVLVFGGFHKEAIKKILKDKGISYVILSPAIGAPSKRHEDYYRMLMSGGQHEFEKTAQSLEKGMRRLKKLVPVTPSELLLMKSVPRESTCPQRAVTIANYASVIDGSLAPHAAPLRNELRQDFVLKMDRVLKKAPLGGKTIVATSGDASTPAPGDNAIRAEIRSELRGGNVRQGKLPDYPGLQQELREAAARGGLARPRLSPEDFFRRPFGEALRDPLFYGAPLIVFADHLDVDAFVSTLSMSYLLYSMLAIIGRRNVPVIPLLSGARSEVDPSILSILDKVFGEVIGPQILQALPFTDEVGRVSDFEGEPRLVQVDSSGYRTWLTVDHHPAAAGTDPGFGSRIERGTSAAFLISREYFRSGLPLDAMVAWMTLYSVMSDTVFFTENMIGSNIYKAVIDLLLPVIRLSPEKLPAIFGNFKKTVYDISHETPLSMLRDTKSTYVEKGVLVSQRFFTGKEKFFDLAPGIVREMEARLPGTDRKIWLFIGTDVDERISYVFTVVSPRQADEQAVHQILSLGGEGELSKDGLRIHMRPEMLRKNLMENISPSLLAVLQRGMVPASADFQVGSPEPFTTSRGIVRYAQEHRREYSWANVVYRYYNPAHRSEYLDALKQLLVFPDTDLRRGAAWICAQTEWIGPIDIPATMGWQDRSLLTLLHDESLSDREFFRQWDLWYKDFSAKADPEAAELLYAEVLGVFKNEREDSTRASNRAAELFSEHLPFRADLFGRAEIRGQSDAPGDEGDAELFEKISRQRHQRLRHAADEEEKHLRGQGEKLLERARSRHKEGDYEAVVILTKRLVKSEPSNIRALVFLVNALLKLNRFKECLKYGAGALMLLKKRTEKGSRRGIDFVVGIAGVMSHAYIGEEDLPKALEVIRQAIEQDPENPEAFRHLAQCYMEFADRRQNLTVRGDLYERALTTADRAIRYALEPRFKKRRVAILQDAQRIKKAVRGKLAAMQRGEIGVTGSGEPTTHEDLTQDNPFSINHPDALADYIEGLVLEVNQAAQGGKEVPLTAIIQEPQKYQQDFYKPLYELFLASVESDFYGAEDFVTYGRDLLSTKGVKALREAMERPDETGNEALRCFQKIKPGKKTSQASVEFYGQMLFFLTGQLESYLGPVYDAIMSTRPGIALAREGISYHPRAESTIRLRDKGILYGTEKASEKYQRMRDNSFDQTKVDMSGRRNGKHALKIAKAIAYWKEQATKLGSQILKDRIARFEASAVVVEFDADLPFIIADTERNVGRIVHTERLTHAFNFSSAFLESLDIDSPQDMRELGVWLNIGEEWLDIYSDIVGDLPEDAISDDLASIVEEARARINLHFFHVEDSGLIPVQAQRDRWTAGTTGTTLEQRIAARMKEHVLKRYQRFLNSVIEENEKAENFFAEALELQSQDPLAMGTGEQRYAAREPFAQAHVIYRKLLNRYESMGMYARAEKTFHRLAYVTAGVQLYDDGGLLPHCLGMELIFTALRLGFWDDFLNELEIAWTGRPDPERGIRKEILEGELRRGYPRKLTATNVEESERFLSQEWFSTKLKYSMKAQLFATPPGLFEERERYVEKANQWLSTPPLSTLKPEDVDPDRSDEVSRAEVREKNGELAAGEEPELWQAVRERNETWLKNKNEELRRKLPDFRLFSYLLEKVKLPLSHKILYLSMGTLFAISGPFVEASKFVVIPALAISLPPFLAAPLSIVLGLWMGSILRNLLIVLPIRGLSKAFLKAPLRIRSILMLNFVPLAGAFASVIGQLWVIMREQYRDHEGVSLWTLKNLNRVISKRLEPGKTKLSEGARGELAMLSPELVFQVLDFQRRNRDAWKNKQMKVRKAAHDYSGLRRKIMEEWPTLFIGSEEEYEDLRQRVLREVAPEIRGRISPQRGQKIEHAMERKIHAQVRREIEKNLSKDTREKSKKHLQGLISREVGQRVREMIRAKIQRAVLEEAGKLPFYRLDTNAYLQAHAASQNSASASPGKLAPEAFFKPLFANDPVAGTVPGDSRAEMRENEGSISQGWPEEPDWNGANLPERAVSAIKYFLELKKCVGDFGRLKKGVWINKGKLFENKTALGVFNSHLSSTSETILLGYLETFFWKKEKQPEYLKIIGEELGNIRRAFFDNGNMLRTVMNEDFTLYRSILDEHKGTEEDPVPYISQFPYLLNAAFNSDLASPGNDYEKFKQGVLKILDVWPQVDRAIQDFLDAETARLKTSSQAALATEREVIDVSKNEWTIEEVEASLPTLARELLEKLRGKDPATVEHMERVMSATLMIARELGIAPSVDLAQAALLHDIGKLEIPQEILENPYPLSASEWSIMKEHAQKGAGLLASIPGFENIRTIVLSHHERANGKGYPRGLKGEEISLEARIIAVADSFDAMIDWRIYQDGIAAYKAVQELIRQAADGHFDASVVKAFASAWQREDEKQKKHREFSGPKSPAQIRAEVRTGDEADLERRLFSAGEKLVQSMSADERRITRVQDVWGLLRDQLGANKRGIASQVKIPRSALQRFEDGLKKYFREQGFPEDFSERFVPEEIRNGLLEVEKRTPDLSKGFLKTSGGENHTLSFVQGDFRVKIPFEYSRNPSVRFVRYGRPSHVGLIKDEKHPGNYMVFQVIGHELWVAHSGEKVLRKYATRTGTSGFEEISMVRDAAVLAFDARVSKPERSEELKRHHSFGFAGFSIYISSGKDQVFELERPDGKVYREGNEKVLTLYADSGRTRRPVLQLRSYQKNAFLVSGIGWKHPGGRTIYPLVIGRDLSEETKSAMNLNRIVDMVRTGELARQLRAQGGKELVVEKGLIDLPAIPSPDYIASGAMGRRVKVTHYEIAPHESDQENPLRLYYAGTITGFPSSDPRSSEGRAEVRSLKNVLADRFDRSREVSFIDLDTGRGAFLPAFQKFLGALGYRVGQAVGTEPLGAVIAQAAPLWRSGIIHANAQLPEDFRRFEARAFDIVTINHIESAPRALGERARELLKPGGVLLVTVEENDVMDGRENGIVNELSRAGFVMTPQPLPADYPSYETLFRSSRLLVGVLPDLLPGASEKTKGFATDSARAEVRGSEDAGRVEPSHQVQPVARIAALGQELPRKEPVKKEPLKKELPQEAPKDTYVPSSGEPEKDAGIYTLASIRKKAGALAGPISREGKGSVRKAVEELKGRFMVVTDMADVANFTEEQLREFEVMAHLCPHVKFVFTGSKGAASHERKSKLQQLQAELGSERVVITESGIGDLALDQGIKVICIAKGNVPLGTWHANKKVFQFRYVEEETGLVPMALLYADQHEKPSEKGTMDLSMVSSLLRAELRAFQNSIVFARAA